MSKDYYLPSEFDLLHDVKNRDQLVKEYFYALDAVTSFESLCKRYNIPLPKRSELDE